MSTINKENVLNALKDEQRWITHKFGKIIGKILEHHAVNLVRDFKEEPPATTVFCYCDDCTSYDMGICSAEAIVFDPMIRCTICASYDGDKYLTFSQGD